MSFFKIWSPKIIFEQISFAIFAHKFIYNERLAFTTFWDVLLYI